eukprot:1778685-Rhodomonas_salina.1
MKAVKVSTHYNLKWLGTLVFQNPAVYAYVTIKHHFESLADIVSVNLAGKLAETLLTKTNVEPIPGPSKSDVSQRHGVRIHRPQSRGKAFIFHSSHYLAT